MSFQDQISSDLKDAMRAGEALKRDTLRMLIAAMQNERIQRGEELDDDAALAVVRKGVKSRRDSATQYRDADRPELAEKEEAEIALLEGYLPTMLTSEETAAAVDAAIAETGASAKSDMGKVMKAVMAKYPGLVDGKLVNQLAAQKL